MNEESRSNEIKKVAMELNDGELEQVSGGFVEFDTATGVPCPKCGNEMQKIFKIGDSSLDGVGRQCPRCCYYELF